jgi:hypothetical protein
MARDRRTTGRLSPAVVVRGRYATSEASWRWWDGSAWSGHVAPARETHELAPLAGAVGRSLRLDQRFGAGTDVLRCEETAVGLMHKPHVGEVSAEASSGAWKFDREGILTGRVRVLVEPSSQEIALFSWDGVGTGTDGTLQFMDGRWLRLVRAQQLAREEVVSPADYDPAHAVWVWYGPDRTPITTVRLASPPPKTKKIFGREIEYTTSSSGTGKTGMGDMDRPAPAVRVGPRASSPGPARHVPDLVDDDHARVGAPASRVMPSCGVAGRSGDGIEPSKRGLPRPAGAVSSLEGSNPSPRGRAWAASSPPAEIALRNVLPAPEASTAIARTAWASGPSLRSAAVRVYAVYYAVYPIGQAAPKAE